MTIRCATTDDLPLILAFIQGLAEYEKLAHEVEATEAKLQATLFPAGAKPAAECILAFDGAEPAGFAIYFYTYSTFLARPGLYLEDLFVWPHKRVLDWNAPAIAFYESLGAKRMTDWTLCRLTGEALEKFR
jgi:hypothetical protein